MGLLDVSIKSSRHQICMLIEDIRLIGPWKKVVESSWQFLCQEIWSEKTTWHQWGQPVSRRSLWWLTRQFWSPSLVIQVADPYAVLLKFWKTDYSRSYPPWLSFGTNWLRYRLASNSDWDPSSQGIFSIGMVCRYPFLLSWLLYNGVSHVISFKHYVVDNNRFIISAFITWTVTAFQ